MTCPIHPKGHEQHFIVLDVQVVFDKALAEHEVRYVDQLLHVGSMEALARMREHIAVVHTVPPCFLHVPTGQLLPAKVVTLKEFDELRTRSNMIPLQVT